MIHAYHRGIAITVRGALGRNLKRKALEDSLSLQRELDARSSNEQTYGFYSSQHETHITHILLKHVVSVTGPHIVVYLAYIGEQHVNIVH